MLFLLDLPVKWSHAIYQMESLLGRKEEQLCGALQAGKLLFLRKVESKTLVLTVRSPKTFS